MERFCSRVILGEFIMEVKSFDIDLVSRNRNLCIEASAGTGKTYTVQQIVAKLLQDKDPLSLEDILIVTYTEKAAGELRDRIRAILKEKKLTEQLSLVDNAPIYTIHSFCKQTLSEFSIEANQNDSLEMIDETAVTDFIEKWIRDELSQNDDFKKYYILSNGKTINVETYADAIVKYYLDFNGNEDSEIIQLDKSITKDADVFRFTTDELVFLKWNVGYKSFQLFELENLRELEKKLSNKSIKSQVLKKANFSDLEPFISNLNAVKKEIETINTQKQSKARTTALENIDKILEVYDSKDISELSIIKTTLLPTDAKGYFGTKATQKQSDLCAYFSDIKTKIDNLNSFISVSSGESRQEIILKKYLFQTQLPEIYKAWNQYKKNNKLQSFEDMIRNVREAICEKDSKLKKALQDKYKYAIIDEFQDTNQKQWDIFKRIFMEDNNHAICVVGDPKQSIYAFQGADINVYSTAVQEIQKTDPENLPQTLDTNYRSTDKMINFCNAIFDRGKDENGNVLYDFFAGNKFQFNPSNCPKLPELIKPNATYNDGEKICEVQPVWVPLLKDKKAPDENVNPGLPEDNFAKFVVTQILDCCQLDENNKTKLQVYKKINGKFVLSNVDFSDFAVLCKSKSEMEPIKQEFTVSGIPFNHYKEDNLFGGKECRDWIALFKALSVPDFSAHNRKVLNVCLYSSFFGISLNEIADKKYDEPQNPQRVKILKWKKTALTKSWALLQEQIYEDSEVEKRLSQLDKLGSLTKLRQIGDYCVNYLYKTNCGLNDLVDHLVLLSKKIDDAEDENGVLVEKGTDFNAVKIMTIHASKGLEFPVVISAAGFKEPLYARNGIYSYHDDLEKYHISCDEDFKAENISSGVRDKSKAEAILEFQRLFYVAYTRATSIMIIHWYENAKYDCITNAFAYINGNEQHKENYLRIIPFTPECYDKNVNKAAAEKILSAVVKNEPSTSVNDATEKDIQKKVLKDLSASVKNLDAYKLSYSTLSHEKKEDEKSRDGTKVEARNRASRKQDDNSEFDRNSIQISCMFDVSSINKISKNYPKGNFLGEAVHQTFEETSFNRIGKLTEDEAIVDKVLRGLIRRKFSGQGIPIDEKDSKNILSQTCKIVWNTLNASLPEVQGNQKTGQTFSLSDLQDNEHYAELEFNMNPEIQQNKEIMRDYFNGFIDLLFVRKNKAGEKIYSVLDWKTDSMDADEYANQTVIAKHTAEEYSIQRVLYSYCLIKWLRQFSNGKDEQWIFDNQFGGIYYVYVRGCKAGTGNGIYAQTWENWAALEKAFKNIVYKKIAKGNN